MATTERPSIPPALDRAAGISWRLIVVIVGVLAVAWALSKLLLVVLPIVIALLITTLLLPPVRFLERRGWPHLLAVWTALLGFLSVFVAIIWFIAPQVVDEFDDLGPAVSEGVERVKDWLIDGPFNIDREQLDRYIEQAGDALRDRAGAAAGGVVTGAVVVAEFVAGFLLALVLSFFFLKDGEQLTGWFQDQLAERHREPARRMGRRAWTALAGYLRGSAIVALVDAIGIGVGLAIIGVPLVLPLAFLTFIGGFFPLVGATVAGLLATLVALVSGGFTDALLVLGVVIAVQQTEGNVLEPLVMGKAVRLHPVVILVAITAGAVLGGLAGAFLAVPVTAVGAAVGNELKQIRQENGDPVRV